MWGRYIGPNTRGKPLSKATIEKIEFEVTDLHCERMISPLKTSSLTYWAQASLKYPFMMQAAEKYHCVPASNATLECSFSKVGHIVRAR